MKMTERRAVALTVVVLMALTVATCLVLGALNADGTAWGVATMFIAGLGGAALSFVMMQFTPPEDR
jgi:hypothetical protein